MKKKFIFLFSIFLLVGCNWADQLNNTPTKKAEEFLNNYQTLNQNVLNDLNVIVAEDNTMSQAQQDEYREFMKKHYQDLIYEIKDETIDGDSATVKVEIVVRDYSKILNNANIYLQNQPEEFYDEAGVYDPVLFNQYRLAQLKEAKEDTTYTLYLYFTKKDKNWVISDLTNTDLDKIHGIYIY